MTQTPVPHFGGMKVLMTGATGFIGSYAARELRAAGHSLRLLVRPSSKQDALQGLDFETAAGDVTQPDTLVTAMEGMDAVVHTAGSTSFLKSDTDMVWHVNVEGTRNVMEAALKVGVGRVLYTSSVAAVGVGYSPEDVQSELSLWQADKVSNHYIRSKRRAEEVAWEVAARGLQLVCVNPGIVLGPGDIYGSSTVLLMNWVKGKYPSYVDGGQSYVDVRDVALGHVLALEKGRAGERYILSGANISNRQIVDLCVQLAGARKLKRVPYALAYLAAAFSEFVATLSSKTAGFNRNTVKSGSAYWYYSNTKSTRELGVSYRPIEESIKDTLRWAMANGYLRPFSPQLEALNRETSQ